MYWTGACNKTQISQKQNQNCRRLPSLPPRIEPQHRQFHSEPVHPSSYGCNSKICGGVLPDDPTPVTFSVTALDVTGPSAAVRLEEPLAIPVAVHPSTVATLGVPEVHVTVSLQFEVDASE